jgi:UDPglucose 6-dehydrogenase
MYAVSVVGLGKLGACMAAAMSSKGLRVFGVDLNGDVVAAINAGQAPTHEPGLDELVAANFDRLTASTDYSQAILETDITFIVVPTPSDEDGAFSLTYVTGVGESIGRALRRKDAYHLVVLTSTVLPGGTEAGLKLALERESGRECGPDFGLCYSPEFVALGSVIRDFLNPELVLIGESDVRAGDVLAGLYGRILESDPPIERMTTPNAELAKIALNTFVTTKITFANMLAEMCERLPGGDVDAVTSALGRDSRVGPRYFSAGLGYGGPCFPRDNRALRHWADRIGAPSVLAGSVDELNDRLGELTFARIRERCSSATVVAFLGLSYKPGSNVLEGSWPLRLAVRLADEGVPIVAYDPLAEVLPAGALDRRIQVVDSLATALDQADVVVVANPDPAFVGLQPADLPDRPVVLIDCWRVMRNAFEESPGVDYVALGLERQLASTLTPP